MNYGFMIAETGFKMGAIFHILTRISILFHFCLLINGQNYPNNAITVQTRNVQQRKECQNCQVKPDSVSVSPEHPFVLESDFSLKRINDDGAYVSTTPGGKHRNLSRNSYTDLGTAPAALDALVTLNFAGSATSDILTQTIDKNQVRSKWEAISNGTQYPGQKPKTKQYLNMKRSEIKVHVQHLTARNQSMARRRRSARILNDYSADYEDSEHIRSSNLNRVLGTIEISESTETYEEVETRNTPTFINEVQEGHRKVKDGATSIEKANALVRQKALKKHVDVVRETTALQNPKGKKHVSMLSALSTKWKEQRIKLSQTAIAKRLKSFADSELGQSISDWLTPITTALKWYILGKNIITGFIHGDTTSLGIIAGKIGLDFVQGLPDLLNTNTISAIFENVKNFDKIKAGLTQMAEWAGPIGFAADIGLSVWSLSKSVGRLNNAGNKFERNDAIADIVGDTVGIVVNTIATALSIAFPPAAPLIQAAAFLINLITSFTVDVYKAINEVDEINERIPLLDFERDEQISNRIKDIFGTRKPDYIDNLVAVKNANNLIVKNYLETLRKHPELAGIVFPARTMTYPGPCNLTKSHCVIWPGFGDWCWKWESEELMATDCEGPHSWCKKVVHPKTLTRICESAYFNVRFMRSYDYYECKCDPDVKPTYGYPRQNNLIDFTQMQNVYLERSVPDDVSDGTFKCKPGSIEDQGYKVSERNTTFTYHCEAAIALLQSVESSETKPPEDQVMLFLLEDGNDTVKLDPNSPENNYYEITNGHKEFYGDAGSDTFQLAGPCSSLSGTLDGREGQDTLIVTENCMNGSAIRLHFSEDECTRFDSLDLYVNSIEVFHGRENQTEEVILSPAILYVNTKGGSQWEADIIKVPNHSSNYSTTIIASGKTVISLEATRGRIQIEANDTSYNTIRIYINLPPLRGSTELSITTSIAQLPSEFITLEYSRVFAHSKAYYFQSTKTYSVYFFELATRQPLASLSPNSSSELYVILNEDSAGSLSYLSMSPSPLIEAFIYHPLSLKSLNSTTLPFTKRIGSSNIKNIFDIKNGTWEVIGGDNDDEFIVHSHTDKWILDGQGGNDVLRFDASLKRQHLDLNLVSGSGLNGRLEIANINTVILPKNFTGNVMCGCDTSGVFAMGGSLLQKITVSSLNCKNLSLEILVSGNSQLSILHPVIWPSYIVTNIASVSRQEKQHLNFAATIPASSGVVLNFQHDGLDWVQDREVAGSSNVGTGVYKITLTNTGGDIVDINVNFSRSEINTYDDDAYFTQPSINFQTSDGYPQGTLFIEKKTGFAKVLHILDTSHATNNASNIIYQRRGMLHFENVFKIDSSGPWHVVGGEKSDIFAIQTNNFDKMVIDGGIGGENVLTFPTLTNLPTLSILNIDLVSGNINFQKSTVGGVIKRFHHILGRDNLPDVIFVRCGILTVNGQGGTKSSNRKKSDVYSDRIIIQNNCSKPIQIGVSPHTIVENSALEGDFYYAVTGAETSWLRLKSTESNSHNILFFEQPWEIISKIAFNVSTSVLNLQSKNGKAHLYSMANIQKGTFHNPEFKFQFNNGSILCQLVVTADGTTHTVYSISQLPINGFVHGLPVTVNNFIINVTKHQATKSSPNYSHGIQGSNSTMHNYFFIYNLAYPIQLLDGKGGQGSANQIQLADDFYPNHQILFNMHPGAGQLIVVNAVTENNVMPSRQHEIVLIEVVKNINEFVGRRNEKDIVYPHCNSTSVSFVEEILISGDPFCMDGYNLIMEIGLETHVRFQSDMGDNEAAEYHYPAEGVFHYRFTSPRTFDIQGSDYVDGIHFYYLPFTIDQLESLAFSKETETLSYSVWVSENGVQQLVNCSHRMITSLSWEDQFYTQPQLLTQDGFHIRISRTGEVTMIIGSEPYGNYLSATEEDIRQELVPLFLNVTKRLEATIIAGLSPEVVMHVGHGPSFKDRNILQNSVNMTSHLVGGGASDTIYDIVDLQRDVYVYPGFDVDDCGRVNENDKTIRKQVIDLSDVVATIRQKHGNKYVPKTENVESDLVLRMTGYEDLFPGSLTIVDSVMCSSKLQLILHAAAMSFKSTKQEIPKRSSKRRQRNSHKDKRSLDKTFHSTQWKIAPDPILVPQGYVYTIFPEDFEIDHEILFQANSSLKSTTNFEILRNGSDLFLTDIQAAVFKDQIYDSTTIVVTNFFDTLQEKRHGPGRHQAAILPELQKVINVRVNLPGVNVILNDTTINSISPMAPPHIVRPPGDIDDVLYTAENYILHDFPNIKRHFERKRCQQVSPCRLIKHTCYWNICSYRQCKGCQRRPPCSPCSSCSFHG